MNRHAEMSAESRSRLIVAAWDLLAEGGSAAATVSAVATRAGISRGSISWHFGSKEGLVVEVVNNAFDMLCDRVGAVFDAPGDKTWERALTAQSVMLTDERFRIFATLGLQAMAADNAVGSAFAAGHRRVRDLYADYLFRNSLVPDAHGARNTATALRAMTLGLNIQRRFDDEIITLTQAFDALRAVGADATKGTDA